MLPVDHYVPENREALIRRYASVARDLADAYSEYKMCVIAERQAQHYAINDAIAQNPATSQSRLDSIAREASFIQWEATQNTYATVRVLELERDLLRDLLGMG